MPHKGVDDLVEALPEGMRLELIGQPYHEQFVADLRRLAAGKDVRFRHDCDDAALVAGVPARSLRRAAERLPHALRGRDAGAGAARPDACSKGWPAARPPSAPDVASMPEVVEDGVTGFVVPPNDPAALKEKLVWLRDNPERRREMGEAARRRVLEKFTWPSVVRNCLEIYNS